MAMAASAPPSDNVAADVVGDGEQGPAHSADEGGG